MLRTDNDPFEGQFGRLGHSLRERREQLGLSQRRLAERVGIRHTHVSRVERGESGVSLSVLSKLADVLQVPPQWLIGESLGEIPPLKMRGDELTLEESEVLSLFRALPKADRRFLMRWLSSLAGQPGAAAPDMREQWCPVSERHRFDPEPNLLAQRDGEGTMTVTTGELSGLGIHEGDLVATTRRPPQDGELVVALVDDVETVLRLYRALPDGSVELASATPGEKSLVVQADGVAIQAVITHVLRRA